MKNEEGRFPPKQFLLNLIMRLTGADLPEARTAAWSFAYFFFLLSAYYILRPIRDEMAAAGGVDKLQWLFTGTFVLMLVMIPAYGWLVSRFDRRKFMPAVYRFFILNLAAFWAFLVWGRSVEVTARFFFMWVSAFNLFAVSVFWSYMADIFREKQAKRLFGLIAAGGTIGALTGPLITIVFLHFMTAPYLLLVSALLLECGVRCMIKLDKSAPIKGAHEPRPPKRSAVTFRDLFSGLSLLCTSRFLALVTLNILLLTAAATFLYFIQIETFARRFQESGTRTQFFAGVDLIVNILAFFLQTFAARRIFQFSGVTGGLALLPSALIGGFLLIAGFPAVSTVAGVLILRRSLNYSIGGPAKEILFTNLSEEEKYKAKNVIDTVVYRGGDALMGWMIAAMKSAGLSVYGLALAGAAASALWLMSSLAVGAGHRKQMENNREQA